MHTHIFIRCDGRYVKVVFEDILYLESKGNYVQVVTVQKTHMALISLRQLEAELPVDLFCRIHRSFLISLTHITAFDNDTVQLDKKEIPIGDNYRDVLPTKVKIVNSETRFKGEVPKLNIKDLLQ